MALKWCGRGRWIRTLRRRRDDAGGGDDSCAYWGQSALGRTVVVQPEAKTGPHHHGELETVLYVVRGRVRMRWGDQLEFSEEAVSGDFIYVPPYVPHQEINAGDEVCEAVVVRNGREPIVVNLPLETPEPASAGRPGMPFHPKR
jgi:uncharacterized RmlC-like cupin family protein